MATPACAGNNSEGSERVDKIVCKVKVLMPPVVRWFQNLFFGVIFSARSVRFSWSGGRHAHNSSGKIGFSLHPTAKAPLRRKKAGLP